MSEGLLRVLRWVLIAFGVMLFLAIIILIFARPSSQSSNQATQNSSQPINIYDFRESGSMRFVQNGNVTAPENHFSIKITVSNSSRIIDIYNGYNTAPASSKSYPNNQASYDAFLGALQGANFTKSQPLPKGITYDTYCTVGIRYSYQIIAGDAIKHDTWNASCNPKNGSFAGNSPQVQQLFRSQIPDYSQLTSKVRL